MSRRREPLNERVHFGAPFEDRDASSFGHSFEPVLSERLPGFYETDDAIDQPDERG